MNSRYGKLAATSIGLSVAFMVTLFGVYFLYGSILALSQAADSTIDVFTSSAILYSLYVGAQPADRNHPRGHYRAEPIAALIAAVLAGVLAFEVAQAAISALLSDARPRLGWPIAVALSCKMFGKLLVYGAARKLGRGGPSPALSALALDARNDVLVCTLAVLGFLAARYGYSAWDAWLSLPIAAWIGWSGFGLAAENVRLLMGEAAPEPRQAALRELVDCMAPVRASHEWKVRYEGAGLDVSLSVVLDEHLPLREAHDIAVEVEQRLLREPDVRHVTVHVDVDPPPRELVSQTFSTPRERRK